MVVSFVIFIAAGLVGWVGAPVLAIIVFARRSAAKKALPSPVAVLQREDVEAPPGKVKDDNTTWAVFCHLGAFAGYFFPLANIIVPLVLWLTKKDESELVDDHGRESVNFQISMLIYMIAAALLTCLLIGIVLLGVLAVFNVIAVIIASVKAGKGEQFRYPLSIRFIKKG